MSSVAHITIEVDDNGEVEFICKTNGDDLAAKILNNIMEIVDYTQRHNKSEPYSIHGIQ